MLETMELIVIFILHLSHTILGSYIYVLDDSRALRIWNFIHHYSLLLVEIRTIAVC